MENTENDQDLFGFRVLRLVGSLREALPTVVKFLSGTVAMNSPPLALLVAAIFSGKFQPFCIDSGRMAGKPIQYAVFTSLKQKKKAHNRTMSERLIKSNFSRLPSPQDSTELSTVLGVK